MVKIKAEELKLEQLDAINGKQEQSA